MTVNERRAQSIQTRSAMPDIGAARSHIFPGEFRSETVIWNGSERRMVTGYASTVERKYRMFDAFGEYDEVIDRRAFDRTLAAKPDVAFLLNHRGVTMARTTNGSLELSVDDKGLSSRAYLNPKRQDVQDLLVAIEDKDITEMSFAFMIEEGEWNEDYTEFRIRSVNLNRGDVSAVNYGANPYTSIKARQAEIIREFREIPRAAQLEAVREARLFVESVERSVDPVVDQAVKDALDFTSRETEDDKRVQKSLDDVAFKLAEQWVTIKELHRHENM